ncbi:hypothetical protein NL676_022206 [Syzygium grande]|nr:hypothetical protein NL676_022206 [Syzygium grande]
MLMLEYAAVTQKNAELRKEFRELMEKLKLVEQGKDQAQKQVLGLDIAESCESNSVPVYKRDPDEGFDSIGRTGGNHAVSGLKFHILRECLELGYGVLLSDVDIVYLQNPFDHLHRIQMWSPRQMVMTTGLLTDLILSLMSLEWVSLDMLIRFASGFIILVSFVSDQQSPQLSSLIVQLLDFLDKMPGTRRFLTRNSFFLHIMGAEVKKIFEARMDFHIEKPANGVRLMKPPMRFKVEEEVYNQVHLMFNMWILCSI